MFIEFSSAFVKTAPLSFHLLLSCIQQQSKQQKLSFDEFLVLTGMLQSSSYDEVITLMSDKLISLQAH